MRVVEIFGSIDGEGLRTGELTTFIRLAGCNMRCSYCDTPYGLKLSDGQNMTFEGIFDQVEEIGYKNITITGGEPMLSRDFEELFYSLLALGYDVNVETNGSMDIRPYVNTLTDDDTAFFTMDYKCPSSGCEDRMLLENLPALRSNDVLKFVVGTKEDFACIKRILTEYPIRSYIYISPIFKAIEPVEIVEFMKELQREGFDVDKMRVQLQLHKLIWHPDERGV